MRPDMAKVIVERPRYGSSMPTKGKGYQRRRQRIALEEQPKREGIKVRGGGQKSLNEHLSPLRRYLAAKVGQRWDKIFADVCRYLDRNSAVQDHVRDHLEDYVATCVIVENGQLYHGDGHGVGRPLYSLFYVCPRTGILKKNRDPQPWRRFAPSNKPRIRFVDELTGLIREDGVWYIVEFQIVPRYPKPPNELFAIAKEQKVFDVLLREKVDRARANDHYGRPICAIKVRRARKSEVRRAVNSYPHTNLVR
jgi:hypothetical protein